MGETRGMELWKTFVKDQQRKERLMKKMIMHWQRYQFFHVKNCWKDWMKAADIEEKRDQVKKE